MRTHRPARRRRRTPARSHSHSQLPAHKHRRDNRTHIRRPIGEPDTAAAVSAAEISRPIPGPPMPAAAAPLEDLGPFGLTRGID